MTKLPKPKKATKNKQQRINIEANKRLKKIYQEKGILTCEAKLRGCMKTFALSFHHRFPRYFYYNRPDLLVDFQQSILVCANCHQKLQQDNTLSAHTFHKLRPVL